LNNVVELLVRSDNSAALVDLSLDYSNPLHLRFAILHGFGGVGAHPGSAADTCNSAASLDGAALRIPVSPAQRDRGVLCLFLLLFKQKNAWMRWMVKLSEKFSMKNLSIGPM